MDTPGAGDGNRTRVSSLEGWCSAIELHRRIRSRKGVGSAFCGPPGTPPALGSAQSNGTSIDPGLPVFPGCHNRKKGGYYAGFPRWSR